MRAMLPLLEVTDFPPLQRQTAETLQVNLGYRCNQRCLHCHVNASPERTEMMSEDHIGLIVPVLQKQGIRILDLTGGAPEMHPGFCALVQEARAAGIHVIDRCNLTILNEPGYEGLAKFLADHQVEVVASLPCYSQDRVDSQRGQGVFARSIQGLSQLNQLGYARQPGLILNLVFNPQGPQLPPDQVSLTQDYKLRLKQDFDIDFNQLYALANMPIQRFGSTLVSKGQFNDYMQLLKSSFQNDNLSGVMCRSLISVDWQGLLYDCDFNQQLGMPMIGQCQQIHLKDLMHLDLQGQQIRVAEHCYGCTAGQGSSCGGAL